jgi:hypothetical protein
VGHTKQRPRERLCALVHDRVDAPVFRNNKDDDFRSQHAPSHKSSVPKWYSSIERLAIAGVATGDGPYDGDDWQVSVVTFNPAVTPYLLTSDEAVAAAEQAGDVTVTRAGDADFRCPVTSS